MKVLLLVLVLCFLNISKGAEVDFRQREYQPFVIPIAQFSRESRLQHDLRQMRKRKIRW